MRPMNQTERRTAYESARSLIAKARSILISGHLSPDGDSLGSMIALSRMLCATGKQAVATADIKALGKPGFLEGTEDLVPLRKLKRRKFDLFVYVDASSPDRLPPEVRPFAEKLAGHVGKRESEREGALLHARADDPGLEHFPHQTQNPRKRGERAHGEDAAEDFSRFHLKQMRFMIWVKFSAPSRISTAMRR